MFNAKYFFQILFLKKEIDKHTNTSFLGQHIVYSNSDDTIVVVLSDTGATVHGYDKCKSS